MWNGTGSLANGGARSLQYDLGTCCAPERCSLLFSSPVHLRKFDSGGMENGGPQRPVTSHLCITSFRHRTSNVVSHVELSYIGQDCERIPITLINAYSPQTKRLDLSFNQLRFLEGLEKFVILEDLILDNNNLDDEVEFPKLHTLKTLSINKNNIKDLEKLLSQLSQSCPNLTYLSLLGNPACPDQLSSLEKDEEDYQKYRYNVLHNLPRLNFLDSSQVKLYERSEAKRVGAFMKVAKPVLEDDSSEEIDEDVIDVARYTPLPSRTSQEGSHQGAYGVLKYHYSGKQSEGNRFIRNHEL